MDKSQLPPTDDNYSSLDKIPRLNNPYVEIIGRGYADEKYPNRRLPNEPTDDKQQLASKPRAKIIKGKMRYSAKKKKNVIIHPHLNPKKTTVLISYLICI